MVQRLYAQEGYQPPRDWMTEIAGAVDAGKQRRAQTKLLETGAKSATLTLGAMPKRLETEQKGRELDLKVADAQVKRYGLDTMINYAKYVRTEAQHAQTVDELFAMAQRMEAGGVPKEIVQNILGAIPEDITDAQRSNPAYFPPIRDMISSAAELTQTRLAKDLFDYKRKFNLQDETTARKYAQEDETTARKYAQEDVTTAQANRIALQEKMNEGRAYYGRSGSSGGDIPMGLRDTLSYETYAAENGTQNALGISELDEGAIPYEEWLKYRYSMIQQMTGGQQRIGGVSGQSPYNSVYNKVMQQPNAGAIYDRLVAMNADEKQMGDVVAKLRENKYADTANAIEQLIEDEKSTRQPDISQKEIDRRQAIQAAKQKEENQPQLSAYEKQQRKKWANMKAELDEKRANRKAELDEKRAEEKKIAEYNEQKRKAEVAKVRAEREAKKAARIKSSMPSMYK